MHTADPHQSGLQASASGENRLMKALLIAAITASAISMLFSVGTTIVSAQMSAAPAASAEH
ncbi:MAG: hypothetical protein KC996_03730 [Phycisphaerales bacterium]|nr:hypothetical protein [Phycisphaerales bacterium]